MLSRQETQAPPIKVAFLGDSVTQFGWEEEHGYVKQLVSKFNDAGINIIPIPAGIAGNTSFDMLKRMDNDVLSKKPNVMFFMGGLNDIWHNAGTIDEYKNNIKQILSKAKENNIEVILMNLTVISEDLDCSMNKEIDRYNNFLAQIAKEENILLVDINSEFKKEIKNSAKKSGNVLTTDGVHMKAKGNSLIADTVFREYLNRFEKKN